MKTYCGLKVIFTAVFTSFLLAVTVTFAKFPASPSLIFIYCVCISFIQGDRKSLILSVICGLLTDILCGNIFFSNTCIFAYISLGCAKLNLKVRSSLKTALLCVFIGTLLYSSFNVLVYFGFRDFSFWLIKGVLPETLISTVLTVIVYPLAVLSTGKQRCFCEKNKN